MDESLIYILSSIKFYFNFYIIINFLLNEYLILRIILFILLSIILIISLIIHLIKLFFSYINTLYKKLTSKNIMTYI